MIKEYANDLKQYDIFKRLKVDYYVDAKEQRVWKVGKIKSMRQIGARSFITIGFDGYPNSWNEELQLPAYNKLACFRRYSLPYTGPTMQIRREPISDLKIQFHTKTMARLELKSSEFINQYYRGQLFILIDYILTKKESFEHEQFNGVLNLFKAYVTAGEKFLQLSLQNIQEILNEGISQYNLIYVCPKMSILYACIEFLFNFNSLVAKHEKRVKFHHQNQRFLPTAQAYKKFKELLIARNIVKYCALIMAYKNKSGRGFPWAIKKEALTVLKSMDQNPIFPQITQSKEAMDVLDYLSYLFDKQTIKKDLYQVKQIQLIILLIKAGTFQRKKKGLTQLKYIMEKASYPKSELNSRLEIAIQEIKKKNLIEFLIDNNNFNSELFKRSIPIFQFAWKNRILSRMQLSKILSLHKDKHQLELKTFYGAFSEFGRFLDQKILKQFFDQIVKTLPLEENMIVFIKDFTFAIANENAYFKTKYMTEGHGFGMTFLWDLIQNNQNKGNEQLNSKIIEALAVLLVSPYYSKQVEYFVTLSMKAIKEKKAIDSNLKLIHEAMKVCKGAKMHRVIESIERDMPIIDTVVKSVSQQKSISQKASENMFEFLEEVNHVAKKGINIGHIKIFWSFKSCRSPLLKFLRKHKQIRDQKSHERIINKQLDNDTIKTLCQGIFSNPDMMDGYCQIDNQLYQTVDQLLICYNHRNQFIDYNYKHTLRVKKLENLYGMDIYCRIILSCGKLQIAQKCLKRLIEYHLRPMANIKASILSSISTTEINAKVNAWLTVAKKIGELDKSTLMGYDILLNQIQGRMKSLNFLQPSIQKIVVKLSTTGKIKILQLPRYTSLWRMRQVIAQDFGLGNTNFEITFSQNNSRTSFDREEDLSIAVIPFPKNQSEPAITVTPAKEVHPHFLAIENFKAEFAGFAGETLYEVISVQNIENQQKIILSILERLPPIKSLEKKIKKLDINNSQDWQSVLDKSCRWKLIYQLNVINFVKDQKLVTGLLQKKAIQHIVKILMTRNQEKQNYRAFVMLMNFFCQLIKFYKIINQQLPFTEQLVNQIFKIPKQIDQEFIGYFQATVSVLKQLLNYKEISVSAFLKSNQITRILEIGLLSHYVPILPTTLVEGALKSNSLPELFKVLAPFLRIQYLQSKQDSCKGFFDLICLIIEKKQLSGDIYRKVLEILKTIRNANIVQRNYDKTNWLIQGWLRIIKILRKAKPLEQIINQSEEDFMNFIIKDCLFNTNDIKNTRFKSLIVRKMGYQILKEFKDIKRVLAAVEKIVQPMMVNGSWRKQFEWNVKPVDIGKKKFTGLRNLAATCYINSLIQNLYYIPSFREGLLELDTSQIQDKQNIAYEIQKMFAFLKYSDNLSYSAASLCRTFILDGQPIDPRVQTDVDQFYHTLMDKLQRNFKQINQIKLIQDIFQGQISNMIIGQECQHTSERLQQCLSLRLQIKDKNNLQQALEQFIKGQILEGDNSYFCEKCDRKVRALKRQCIKSLPNILILTLKRFEFDFQTMEKFKLNTFCSFPEFLNMLPFTRQGIAQEETGRKEDYYNYRLKGVVIHYGISQAGHYTSYIRTRANSWQYFDDERVQQFNFNKDLAEQCFGGKQINPYGDDQDKKKNAYLLFYEKITVNDQKLELPINLSIKKEVQQDNLKNQIVRLLFDENLQNLISENGNYGFELYFVYFHLVMLRNRKNISKMSQFYKKCQQMITANKEIAKWYLVNANEQFIYQFVIFGDKQAKYLVTSLLIKAVQAVFVPDFIKRCVKCLQRKYMTPFTKIFRQACNSHPEYTKILAQLNLGERIMKIITDPSYIINLTSVEQTTSVFGRPSGDFIQRRDQSDGTCLLQTVESLKVNLTIQDIKVFSYKAKAKQTQSSLAKIVVRKHKTSQNFEKFINGYLIKELYEFQAKSQEYYVYDFYIQLVKQFALVKDEHTPKRIDLLAGIYMQSLKRAIEGYKAMRMLLQGLFNICFTNLAFRDRFSALINEKDNKKYIKAIKQWMKESQNLSYMIKSDRWGFWRKPKSRFEMASSFYSVIDKEQKLPTEQYMSYLNAIVEKHNINYQGSEGLKVNSEVYLDQFHGRNKYMITNQCGLLLEITGQDGGVKLIPDDDPDIIMI